MVKICKKMNKAAGALEYFTTHKWSWSNKNMLSLQEEMTKEDREKFNFNVRSVHWPEFLDNFVKVVSCAETKFRRSTDLYSSYTGYPAVCIEGRYGSIGKC